MNKISNPAKKIKLNSSMLEEFSSPIKENPNTYMRVDINGDVQYKNPGSVAIELGGTLGSTITEWNAYTTYFYGQLVTYKNNIWSCDTPDYHSDKPFNPDEWKLIAGYQKNSSHYSFTEPTSSLTLSEPVSDKSFIQVNIDNNILQTNQYELDSDGVTVRFIEPIPANSNVNIITFGNFTIVKGSNIQYVQFIAEEGQTRFEVPSEIAYQNLVNVNIENSQILNSEFDIENQHIIVLKNPVNAGDRVQISYWENLELDVSVTFTPIVEKYGRELTLSWENDGGVANPDTYTIYDGITFTPKIEKTDSTATLSWENDGGVANPEPLSIYTNYSKRMVETFLATENQTVFKVSKDIYDKSVLSVNIDNVELTSGAYYLEDDKRTVTLVDGVPQGSIVEFKYFYNLYIGDNTTINVLNSWDKTIKYPKSTIIKLEDSKYIYTYIAKKDVPENIELNNTEYWFELLKVYSTTYIDGLITKLPTYNKI